MTLLRCRIGGMKIPTIVWSDFFTIVKQGDGRYESVRSQSSGIVIYEHLLGKVVRGC